MIRLTSLAGTSQIFVFNENISDQKIIISGGVNAQCLDKRQEAKHYHVRPRQPCLCLCLYTTQLLRFCSIVSLFVSASIQSDWGKKFIELVLINRRK